MCSPWSLWSKYSPRKRISDFWSRNHETETPVGLSHTPSHFYRRLWKLTQTPRAQRLRSEHEGDASWVADTLAEYTAVSSDTNQGGLSSLTNIQLSKRLWYLCKPGLQHIDSLHHSSAEEVPQGTQAAVPQQSEEGPVHYRLAGGAGKQVVSAELPVHTFQKAQLCGTWTPKNKGKLHAHAGFKQILRKGWLPLHWYSSSVM